tara:strand:- start:250 stop:507 length:258 start_codon:yes stop_codon:yes gene_type:complete
MDDILNDNQFEDYIEQLSELVFAKIINKYGNIYPLEFLVDEEEILIGELARLNTTLIMLEEREEYEKCKIIANRIRNIEKKLEKL